MSAYQDQQREIALNLAVSKFEDSTPEEVVERAEKYLAFLQGEDKEANGEVAKDV